MHTIALPHSPICCHHAPSLWQWGILSSHGTVRKAGGDCSRSSSSGSGRSRSRAASAAPTTLLHLLPFRHWPATCLRLQPRRASSRLLTPLHASLRLPSRRIRKQSDAIAAAFARVACHVGVHEHGTGGPHDGEAVVTDFTIAFGHGLVFGTAPAGGGCLRLLATRSGRRRAEVFCCGVGAEVRA
eukprot:366494-Chlamydomonas_euryale.AAC.3